MRTTNNGRNCGQQSTCRIQTIIASHTGIAYHVEHNAQGKQPHHGFNLLISVECACVEYYPWVYCTFMPWN